MWVPSLLVPSNLATIQASTSRMAPDKNLKITRSNFCKPHARSVHLAPLLDFKRKARPRPCHVDQNISHSRIWCLRCHPLAFSRADSASFRSKHGSPQKGPLAFISTQNPAEREPAGFQMRLARYGLAKLAHKPGDPPKRSKKSVRKML